ncbi:VOC family protein [Sphingorhabdus sp. EL138]|jgi:PhnB protein|uniref:VOC family protein n=1 Tax=Sphingorhabdus sp. EL138 TaxID=2073156 RepID=UPI000D69F972|nr:VOC family protein [Sphingorhabdus sp. EL138]
MQAVQSSPTDLCPYITVAGAAEAIEFYTRAFGASVDFKLVDPSDQRIGHAELRFGSSRIFISDEYPDFGAASPETIGGSPVKLHLEVADADAFVAKAVEEGATELRSVKQEFHGYRTGMVADPYGYSWFVASKVEEVDAEEMQKRWDDMTGGQS